MQYNTYLYIYSINKLQFIGQLKLCIFIGIKKIIIIIIQSTNHVLFNLIIILPLSNLTYAFGAQDNESPARSRWAADRYIYIKKICTRLVHTIDTVPLGYGSVCHNSTFVRFLLVYQFIINSNSNGYHSFKGIKIFQYNLQ